MIKDYDICIIGSGIAGASIAKLLSRHNYRIALIDRGSAPDISTNEKLRSLLNKTNINSQINVNSDIPYNPNLHRLFCLGGTWEMACGNAVRLEPDDFFLKSKHNIGLDWPISYGELEKYYTRAEDFLNVSGDSNPQYSNRWRSKNYPHQPFPFSESDKILIEAGKSLGINVDHMPQARNVNVCIGSNSCSPYCPTSAKFSAYKKCIIPILDNIDLYENSVANTFKESSKIVSISIKSNNQDIKITGKYLIIAAGTIESFKLIYRSANYKNKYLGLYYMEHPQISIHSYIPNLSFKSRETPMQTARIDKMASINGRYKNRFVVEFNNHEPDANWYKPSKEILSIYKNNLSNLNKNYVRISVLSEQIPTVKNRLYYIKNELNINYNISKQTMNSLAAGERLAKKLIKKSNGFIDKSTVQIGYSGHQMGTAIMGNSSKDSVVNKDLHLHEHNKVFVLGSNVFPTSGVSNPTLTIIALAIRLSDYISKIL